MNQYHDLVNHILTHGTRKENRTGVDTISTFGYYYEHDLRDGFPLLTTKRISWKNIVIENLWFLSGDPGISCCIATAASSGMPGPMRVVMCPARTGTSGGSSRCMVIIQGVVKRMTRSCGCLRRCAATR